MYYHERLDDTEWKKEAKNYTLLTTGEEAIRAILEAVAYSQSGGKERWVSLDFETTGLDADTNKVRLVSLANCNNGAIYVIDFGEEGDTFGETYARLFAGGNFVVFNMKFEASWWVAAGLAPPNLYDVGLLRRAWQGGGVFNLMTMAAQDLKIEMDKSHQSGVDETGLNLWGGKLSAEQYDYSAGDAYITNRLWHEHLTHCDEGRWNCFLMFNALCPAVMEMERSGLLLDSKRQEALVAHWEELKNSRIAALDGVMVDREKNTKPILNYGSEVQWSKYLSRILPARALTNWPKTSEDGDRLSMKNEVLLIHAAHWGKDLIGKVLYLYVEYRKLSTYLSNYGNSLIGLAKNTKDGRLHPSYNVAFARPGRFSSTTPNAQALPRDTEMLGEELSIRKSIIAPEGKLLVSYDYSGIEIRVAALLSGDKALLEEAVYGDLHSKMGSVLAGRTIDKSQPKDKQIRSAAKSGTFALLYGGGANGVASNMKMGVEDGERFIEGFKKKYPIAYDFRHKIEEIANGYGYIRAIDGGTIHPRVGFGARKKKEKGFTLPECSNYPVQRAALTIMARALIAFKNGLDHYRKQGRLQGTLLISTIHDQIIAECAEADADFVSALMQKAMIHGFSQVFPGESTENLVEGGKGKSWGELD